ncbi:MAG: NADH:flavin oxidoreductase [Acidimicrobiaceae bacterium]|nr:NADH:flavin oxidoreductase [Ilumatobacter sp.]MCB9381366.1 NADH:flavin oxidoreductase [Acidimicrobiaceae bacterium]MCO5330318.1 NADH:flavin oxidoreductase [Ilumatobacteraceae bacterium]
MTSPLDPVSFRRGPAMPNRLMLAPLTNRQSHADGTLSEEEHRWLAMRAEGGFGLTMTCAAHVQSVGQGFAGQLGIFGDQHLDGLTRLAASLNATGTVSYAQLHHAGNRAPADLIGTQPVCPSDDPETGARALTTAEVEQAVADFVAAAVRAERAGFRGVELHGAHGYLICQFLSPEINRRTDHYGGSLENRSRFLFEVLDGVRAACGPDLAVAVRLSPDRFGMRTEEIVEVYGRLVDGGQVDLLDMSLWDFQRATPEGPFEGRPLLDLFAEQPRGDVRLGVAGKIHDPADVQEVLDRGVDIAVLGRVAILHHDYPRLLANPGFEPRRPPVTPEVLAGEGVSPAFVEYLSSNFRGFVAGT